MTVADDFFDEVLQDAGEAIPAGSTETQEVVIDSEDPAAISPAEEVSEGADFLAIAPVELPRRKAGRPKKSVVADTGNSKKSKGYSTPPVVPIDRFSDDRKLTKKGATQVQECWLPENRTKTRNSLMEGMRKAAREKFGVSSVFGSRGEISQLVTGIPTPSLPFEYLIANDIFPVCAVIQISGPTNTCKSALSYEFFRWFYESSGVVFHIDTEHKFDSEFACGIMRVPPDVLPFISARANSTEDWQKILTHSVLSTRDALVGSKDQPGPYRMVPVCYCLDSLGGVASEELQEKILSVGHATRSHPYTALINSGYLRNMKSYFSDYPFTFMIVNHLSEKADDRGNTVFSTPGGQQVSYQESFEIRTGVWKQKIQTASFEGIGIKLWCSKNSFGPGHRRIKTRFLWWQEPMDDGTHQARFLWDWDWAIVTLLHELTGKEKQALTAAGLSLKVKSPAADVECMACMPALGMGKEEYRSFQEVGRMIHENEGICNQLRQVLGITCREKLDRPLDQIIEEFRRGVE